MLATSSLLLIFFGVEAVAVWLESYFKSRPELYLTKGYKSYLAVLAIIWIVVSALFFRSAPIAIAVGSVFAVLSLSEKLILSKGKAVPRFFNNIKFAGYFIGAMVFVFFLYDIYR